MPIYSVQTKLYRLYRKMTTYDIQTKMYILYGHFFYIIYTFCLDITRQFKSVVAKQKCKDYMDKWPFMVSKQKPIDYTEKWPFMVAKQKWSFLKVKHILTSNT